MADLGAVALALAVLLPAAAGVVLLLGGRRADGMAAPLALTVTVLTLLASAAAALTRPQLRVPFLGLVEGGELGIGVDGLSAVMVVTVASIALAVMVFAVVDHPREQAPARFLGYLLLFVAAMLLTVTAQTFPALMLGWEVMGATSYALIAFHWRREATVTAATTAFLTTRAADLGLYVAAGAALAATGTLRLADLNDLDAVDGGWAHVIAAGLLLAALGKSAQLPFSAWLSAAMQGPSPVSALLHSATMVAAGGYLLIRVQPLLAGTGWGASTAAWIGALTALVLGAIALAQTDLKQLLAASTAAQIGFVVLAAGVGTTAGGTMHLVAHAAVKAGLFIIAGTWLSTRGTKQLRELRGAARTDRRLGVAAVVLALALAGVPPLSLWATKDEVLAGVGGTGLHLVALAAAALSAAYAAKVLAVLLAAPASPRQKRARSRRAVATTIKTPLPTTAIAAVLAALAAGLGVLALPVVAEQVKAALGATEQPSPGAAELLTSGLIALAVTAAVLWRPKSVTWTERSPLAGWLGSAALLSPRPGMTLARSLARFDDRVLDPAVLALPTALRGSAAWLAAVPERGIDAVVDGAARTTSVLGRRTAVADVRGVDGVVAATATAIGRAGSWARRPQTGMLHQYYVMAAIGLGALLLLLLLR